MPTDDGSPNEILNYLGSYFSRWFYFDSLAKVIDHNKDILSLSANELYWTNEVHPPYGKGLWITYRSQRL